jgi:Gpi18-like mannosyltransferase
VVALRFVLLGFGYLAVAVVAPATLHDGLLGIWNRWDGPHFLEVAATGYGPPTDPARIVLFPLFPGLENLGGFLMPPLLAGMLISLVSTVAAAVGLHRLVRFDGSERLARWSIVAMLVFPTAYAFVAPYSEALFLALTVWAFVAMRRNDAPMAGLLGALAALTRIQGVFLLPALGIEYLMVRRKLDRDVFWIGFIASGLIAYLFINYAYFGDPLYFVYAQEHWFHVHNEMPWVAVPSFFNAASGGSFSESQVTVYIAPLVSLGLLALVTIWATVSKHSRPSYALYCLISLVAFASLSWPISVPRYLMGVFPIFIALGSLFRSAIGQVFLIASVLLLAIFTMLFVEGHWAF